jgi:hypothetical protein
MSRSIEGHLRLHQQPCAEPDVDLKKPVNDGVIPGPRLLVSTRVLFVTGAYGPSGYSPEIS